jgi:hypothetical protein
VASRFKSNGALATCSFDGHVGKFVVARVGGVGVGEFRSFNEDVVTRRHPRKRSFVSSVFLKKCLTNAVCRLGLVT